MNACRKALHKTVTAYVDAIHKYWLFALLLHPDCRLGYTTLALCLGCAPSPRCSHPRRVLVQMSVRHPVVEESGIRPSMRGGIEVVESCRLSVGERQSARSVTSLPGFPRVSPIRAFSSGLRTMDMVRPIGHTTSFLFMLVCLISSSID